MSPKLPALSCVRIVVALACSAALASRAEAQEAQSTDHGQLTVASPLAVLEPSTPERAARFCFLEVGSARRENAVTVFGQPTASSANELTWERTAFCRRYRLLKIMARFDNASVLQQVMVEFDRPEPFEPIRRGLRLGDLTGTQEDSTGRGQIQVYQTTGAAALVSEGNALALWLLPGKRQATMLFGPPAKSERPLDQLSDEELDADLAEDLNTGPTGILDADELEAAGDGGESPRGDMFADPPPADLVPLIGAPWQYHSYQGISPLHTTEDVLRAKLGRPVQQEADPASQLTYHHYETQNARLVVGTAFGMVFLVDAVPKLPLNLAGAVEEFELSTPVRVPKLAPSAARGPAIPQGLHYYRCGYNTVVFTRPAASGVDDERVVRLRLHAWNTRQPNSQDSDSQFGVLPPRQVLELPETNRGKLR